MPSWPKSLITFQVTVHAPVAWSQVASPRIDGSWALAGLAKNNEAARPATPAAAMVISRRTAGRM